ncbi:MAG: hypothetical protein Q4G70_14845 [Pseudomonadota bacterium]|nr:hypothetical protein [Pseudomonadota bacterium]
MSNRVYLYCTNFKSIPKPDEWDAFNRQSGVEYEAKACIPIFWLCLFSISDIKIVSSDHNGFDDDWRPYAYLLCSRQSGIERLRVRSLMIKNALGDIRFSLYSEWLQRMENEPYDNVLVLTEELDWMEQEEGALEKMLIKSLQHLEKVSAEGSMKMSNAMNDIAGLWSEETLNECESYELSGNANENPSWPLPFVKISKNAGVVIPNKPWWIFWR